MKIRRAGLVFLVGLTLAGFCVNRAAFNFLVMQAVHAQQQNFPPNVFGGIIDGLTSTFVTTGTTATVGGTYSQSYYFNQNATAAAGVTYTLPAAVAGKAYCFGNSYNGTAANTGVLTIAASASGQFIIFTDGTLSASGGNVTSGGAAGDYACVVGADTTHWYLRTAQGTWTKH